MAQQLPDAIMEASLPVAQGPQHTVLPGLWTLSQDTQHLLQQGQHLRGICFCQRSECPAEREGLRLSPEDSDPRGSGLPSTPSW